jgi:hypothetical protein
VSDNVDTSEFFVEELGLLSGILGDRQDDVRARYERRGLKFKGFEKITVPASTLGAILSKHLPPETEIDFISIDVEGTEIEVLRGMNLSRFRPRVIVIEALSKEAGDRIDTQMVDNGYLRARNLGTNLFYARDQKDVDTLRSIPVDCRIEKNVHPLGERYTPQVHIAGKVIRQSVESRKMNAPVGRRIFSKVLAMLRI